MRMNQTNSRALRMSVGLVIILCSLACDPAELEHVGESAHDQATASHAQGPNGGLLLRSGSFALELGLFEEVSLAEYNAWATLAGEPLDPNGFGLELKLTRLGGRVDRVAFTPSGDHVVSTSSIAEPHSFEVSIEATHGGQRHTWAFEQFEGRTQIDSAMAASLGVASALAGPAVLAEVVTVYGRVRVNPERVREIRARFDGTVRSVHAGLGSRVRAGDALLSIESDESLNRYTVAAPIAGVVTQRSANAGEQTSGRLLMTITDDSSVWVDLSVFPVDRDGVVVGIPVSITPALSGSTVEGSVSMIEIKADPHDQSVIARVALENAGTDFLPGTFVTAQVRVGVHEVPLAVKNSGLQAFRDFRVVYAVVGDTYEVRMLDLGRSAGEWVEVLGGLEPGTRYVVENSHLIKADIEKSGASHDH
jgi:cobalt-zinc-cadmium efflux system membrane fusion protein